MTLIGTFALIEDFMIYLKVNLLRNLNLYKGTKNYDAKITRCAS